MEFVKADQTVPLCNASGQGVERIGNALKRLQLPVRLAHKGMEMHARFGLDWNAGIETVHQKTLPRPTPPHRYTPFGVNCKNHAGRHLTRTLKRRVSKRCHSSAQRCKRFNAAICA